MRFLLVVLVIWVQHSYGQTLSWLVSKNLTSSAQHLPIDMAASQVRDANYITGSSYAVTLNSGVPLQSGPSFGLLVKVNQNGDTLWTWKNSCNFSNVGAGLYPRNVVVDQNDNVIISGFYNMPSASSTITIGTTNLATGSVWGGSFIARFDSSGNVQSVISYQGYAQFNDLDIDSSGNIYIIGNTRTAYTFGSYTIAAPTSLSGGGNSRDFLLALNSSGTVLWAKGLGELDLANAQLAAGNEGGQHRIAVTKNSPTLIFTSGFYLSSYSFTGASFSGAGREDALVLKFDQNGNYITSQSAGGSYMDAYYDIKVNKNRKIAVTGMYRTATNINNTNYSCTTNYCQNLIVCFDTALNYSWVDTAGLGCGNYPHIGIDDYNRICMGTGANGMGNNFLYFYNENAVRNFTKTYTYQNSVNFAGFGPFAFTFPKTNPGNMYFTGSYKPTLTIDNLSVSSSVNYANDIVLGKIAVPIPCKPDLGPDTGYCNTFNRVLQSGIAQASYLWSTNDTSASISVSQPGSYWVRVTKSGCTASDTITILRDTMLASFTDLHDTTLCSNTPLLVNVPSNNARSFKWWNNLTSNNVMVASNIIYPWIEYRNYCGVVRDSMIITRLQKAQVNLGKDTTLCSFQQMQLNAGNPGYAHLWSTNDTSQNILIINAGIYWVDVSNYCGTVRDSIVIDKLPIPAAQLGSDTFICGSNTITLTSNSSNATSYLWSTNASTSSIQVGQSGTYIFTASNRCGSQSDSVIVKKYVIPQLHITGNSFLCNGTQSTLNVQANETFLWSTMDTTTALTISAAGKYWVSSSNVCGLSSDTIAISALVKASPALGNDTLVCTPFVSVSLYANTQADFYRWSTGVQGSNLVGITAMAPGWYWIDASNTCGTARDSILVQQSRLPIVNLGKDTIVKFAFSITLDAGADGKKYHWSRSASDTLRFLTTNQPGIFWADVTNACGTTRDSILISTNTGIVQTPYDKGFHLYPNPASDIIYLMNENNLNITEIKVVDITAKEILNICPNPGESLNSIQLNRLSNGLYWFIIKHSMGTTSLRINISR